MVSNSKLKIFFHPIDAAGHINACLGLGQALAARGHEIAFLSDTSFKGHFVKFGFREILLKDHRKLAEPEETVPEAEEDVDPTKPKVNPLKELSKVLADSGMLSNMSSLERMKNNKRNNLFFDEMCKKIFAYNDQIKKCIELENPDLIIVDNFIFEPIILHSEVPWIFCCSCNPLGIFDSKELPPFCSGYATNSDRESWKEFQDVLDDHFETVFKVKQDEILHHFNYPNLERKAFIHRSPYLNIYGYPEELDYHDVVPIPEKFVRVDAFCRDMPEPFELPVEFQNKIKSDDKLIFVSLGSMGSFNVELMTKMVEILSKTPHKYIVSKGPLHDEFELGDNMWGDEYVQQTSILPLVDLVITHGGNNTVTESFSFGKPMIVMPLFGDQYDNAQRVHEKGFGIRLNTYEYSEKELIDSIEQLLNDTELNQRLAKISKRIQHSNSKELACIAIEQMVEERRRKDLQTKTN